MSVKGKTEPGRGVTFVFDRMMHYHIPTTRAIESRLAQRGVALTVLSALDAEGAVGRVATRELVVARHHHFRLSERRVGGFQLRYQHGVHAHLRAIRPAVIITTCHSGTLSEWSILRWARRHGIRRVAWQCGYEYNPGIVKRIALARFVPQFDFHLCYHSNARAYALQHGAREEQTFVMHNTIDETRVVPIDREAARALLVQRHPELRDRNIVLYVGAVLEEKRLELVFEALAGLGRKDTVFVLVGSGPHLNTLKARYASRNDWLSTGAVVEGVGMYFDAADVLVLPGTGGLAINEAMAHRLPVVSGYADGSADDLVRDGVTGYRLRAGSASELADRLGRLLNDPEAARRIGRQGEALVRGELSFSRFVDGVVGVLAHQHELALQHS